MAKPWYCNDYLHLVSCMIAIIGLMVGSILLWDQKIQVMKDIKSGTLMGVGSGGCDQTSSSICAEWLYSSVCPSPDDGYSSFIATFNYIVNWIGEENLDYSGCGGYQTSGNDIVCYTVKCYPCRCNFSNANSKFDNLFSGYIGYFSVMVIAQFFFFLWALRKLQCICNPSAEAEDKELLNPLHEK